MQGVIEVVKSFKSAGAKGTGIPLHQVNALGFQQPVY